MSIVISNISEQYNKEYGKGNQHYVLCINNNKLVEFEHNFNDGLATCLRRAADAFDKMEEGGRMPIYKRELFTKFMEGYYKEQK